MIHLAHPRIEARDDARRAAALGDRGERAHADHRKRARRGDALRDPARDAQPGERARTRAVRDAVEIARSADAGAREQRVDLAEDRARRAAVRPRACVSCTRAPPRATASESTSVAVSIARRFMAAPILSRRAKLPRHAVRPETRCLSPEERAASTGERSMNTSAAGLRVLVTAGAAGIGRAIAQTFVAHGARVHICDVDRGALEEVKRLLPQVTQSVTDVASAAEVDRLFVDVKRDTRRPRRARQQRGNRRSDREDRGPRIPRTGTAASRSTSIRHVLLHAPRDAVDQGGRRREHHQSVLGRRTSRLPAAHPLRGGEVGGGRASPRASRSRPVRTACASTASSPATSRASASTA